MSERVLIFPPFSDPTRPVDILAKLKAQFALHQHSMRVIDLNIEAVHFLFSRPQLEETAEEIGRRFIHLNDDPVLDFEEQREYRALADARRKIEFVLDADPSPLEVFRDPALFYDPEFYMPAKRRIDMYFDALHALIFPFYVDFGTYIHDVVPWSTQMFQEFINSDNSPLLRFYRRLFDDPEDWDAVAAGFPWLPLEDVEFTGLAVLHNSQLPETLVLAAEIRKRQPHMPIVLFGERIQELLKTADASFCKLLGTYVDGVSGPDGYLRIVHLFDEHPEFATLDVETRRRHLGISAPTLTIGESGFEPNERVAAYPVVPDYSEINLDRYLAPSRLLPFSLDEWFESQTSAEASECDMTTNGVEEKRFISRAVVELSHLAKRHGVKDFQISAKNSTPEQVLQFAEAILEKALQIRWTAHLAWDRRFTRERCEKLRKSGLRVVSFDVSGGSDRLLALTGTPLNVSEIRFVNRLFHEADMACQWRYCAGVPSEVLEESLAGARFLAEECDRIDGLNIVEFSRCPDLCFNLSSELRRAVSVEWLEGDELKLHPIFRVMRGSLDQSERRFVAESLVVVSERYATNSFPFAGAFLSHHSYLFFLKYGASALKTVFQRAHAAWKGPLPEPRPTHFSGLRERARFSADLIRDREEEFFGHQESMLPEPRQRPDENGSRVDHPRFSLESYLSRQKEMPLIRAGWVH